MPRTTKRMRTPRNPRPCRAYKKVGSIRRQVHAGRAEIAFSGRVAGRKLAPGFYRAILTVGDAAGNVSRTERVRFRVIRARA